MKIIIPMAGMGKRMRPHTLTVPKPLLPVAGKPIVYRLVEDLAAMCDEKVDEIAFVIGRSFGPEAEKNLVEIAEKTGAKGTIYYQDEPLGTAHAIYCAEPSLEGHTIVAFADTLFYADFKIDTSLDGIIWTKCIKDPSAFGVVEKDDKGNVKRFVEKPKEFVSDEAIIGIYYFGDGNWLRDELKYLLDNDIKEKGEFQLTAALDNMLNKNARFKTANVTHWLDCGNKAATVDTNQVVLQMSYNNGNGSAQNLISPEAEVVNSVVHQPCYIGPGATVRNSVLGPYASVGAHSVIDSSVVSNSIIMTHAKVKNANLRDAMLGNYSYYDGKGESVNLGDYSEVK